MKNVLIFFLLFSPSLFATDKPVSCAPPPSVKTVRVSVSTVKNGSWFDPQTWSNGKVPAETDDVTIRHMITSSNRSIIRRAALNYRYEPGQKAGLIFTDIDETKFIEGSLDVNAPVVPQNTGLYILAGGHLNLNGEKKTSWTRTTGSLVKGTTVFHVKEASNWKIGDEIFIVPTRTPQMRPGAGSDDQFALEFERRKIKAISGRTITIDALQYDHLMVDGQFTAEVGNITRSFIMGGTAEGRSLVFILSDRPQIISNIELAYTGGGRKTGVYALHFHMMHDASRGSLVENVAAHDNNFRVFVPHMSHGITINNNISFDTYGESLWYDHQQPTHNCKWTNNLIALTRVRPGVQVSEGINIGQGVGNMVNNNVAVYASTTNGISNWPLGKTPRIDARGAYNWHADNVGDPAQFKDNMAHSNITGLWWWQNTPHATHTVERFTAYNNWRGVFLGAYINSLNLWDNYYFNSPVEVKATAGNTIGTGFVRATFKTDGAAKYLVYVQDSPIASGETNKFINCKFIGADALVCYSPIPAGDPAKQPKKIDLINNEYTGKPFEIHPSAHQATQVFINPANQPELWGTGTGLKGEYYNDTSLTTKVGERLEPMLRFYSTWKPTVKESPTGPYYKITGDNFSVRFTGQYQPQYSGEHFFEFEGSTGVRLWIDNRLILDSWTDKLKETDTARSSPIQLTKGRKYAIRLEVVNQFGKRRAILRYYTAQSGTRDIPMYQLYPK